MLAKRNRKLDNKNDPHSLFEDLYKTIQDPNFCGIMKTASEERIKNAKYPVNMRKIQKLTVDSLTISDPSRKEVSTYFTTIIENIIHELRNRGYGWLHTVASHTPSHPISCLR